MYELVSFGSLAKTLETMLKFGITGMAVCTAQRDARTAAPAAERGWWHTRRGGGLLAHEAHDHFDDAVAARGDRLLRLGVALEDQAEGCLLYTSRCV